MFRRPSTHLLARRRSPGLTWGLVLAVFGAGALMLAAPAIAGIPRRSPQIVFNLAPLQQYFNVEDPGIASQADQLDVPSWSRALIGFNFPNLTLRQTNGSTIGIYGTGVPNPTLVPIFNPQSAPGSYVLLGLASSTVHLYFFDANSLYLGQTDCPDIQPDHFQFYMQGACGTWFGEDARNSPPAPQLLTYGGISEPLTSWWLCFEGCPYAAGGQPPSTFTSAIVELEYIYPLDAKARSWGAVKARYR